MEPHLLCTELLSILRIGALKCLTDVCKNKLVYEQCARFSERQLEVRTVKMKTGGPYDEVLEETLHLLIATVDSKSSLVCVWSKDTGEVLFPEQFFKSWRFSLMLSSLKEKQAAKLVEDATTAWTRVIGPSLFSFWLGVGIWFLQSGYELNGLWATLWIVLLAGSVSGCYFFAKWLMKWRGRVLVEKNWTNQRIGWFAEYPIAVYSC